MTSYLRKRVSQNRKRLKDGKYDLDLTYITDNLIAMGYPSDKTFQKLIRNQIETVSKYLNEKHENSFKIFNLCNETDYDISHFNHMVEIIPVEDHCPPKFFQIQQFCQSLHKWLCESEDNVGIVHCKAGKGRTGTMIACYFIHSKMFPNPFEAIKQFNCRRCKDQRGITIPSQLRYIEYYADFVLNNRVYQRCELILKSIKIDATHELTEEFTKNNEYGRNEAESYLGKKVFKQKMEINENVISSQNTEQRSIHWELKKKHIDLINKIDDIQPRFTLTFEFELATEIEKQANLDYTKTIEENDNVNNNDNGEKVSFKVGSTKDDTNTESSINTENSSQSGVLRDYWSRRDKQTRRSNSEPLFMLTSNASAPELSISTATASQRVKSTIAQSASNQNFSDSIGKSEKKTNKYSSKYKQKFKNFFS